MFRPYSYYKVNIDLVQYLLNQGYVIDKSKSSRSCTALRDNSGGVLLVRRNSDNQEYFYTNPMDSTDKGNIVDFISRRNSLDPKTDFEYLNKLLSEASGMAVIESKFYSSNNKAKSDFENDLLIPLEDYRYLVHRGIETSVFFSKPFKGTILNHKKVMPDGKTFLNLAFPLKDKEGKIVGSELKNFGFKGCAEGSLKEIGAWHSDIYQNGVLGLSENPVDGLSAHQLFLKDINDIGYLSFGGGVSEKQIFLVNHFIKYYDLQQIILLFDNDLTGLFYDCLISGTVLFEDRGEGFSFKTLMDKEKGIFKLIFECVLPSVRYFRYHQLCKDNFQLLEGYKGFKLVGQLMCFEFLLSEDMLRLVSDMVLKLRSLDKYIIKKKPQEHYKDFNDELRGLAWDKNK